MEFVRSYIPPPRTPEEIYCNTRIASCRESIEWHFGDISVLFKICNDPAKFKLAQRNPYAIEQLRVCHLLGNIHNCLNGGKASGALVFCCEPPELEEYLRLN
jgi:hypothetical protein